MKSYVTDIVEAGRKTYTIDLASFAADIAKALGGELLPSERPGTTERDIRIGADILSLTADNWKRRVTASIVAPDVKHDDRNWHSAAHRPPKATVNPDGRTVERIAADIQRRVVEAGQPALTAQREYAAQRAVERNGLASHVAALKAAFPDFRFEVSSDRASIWGGAATHYISASVNGHGTVNIERLGSMSVDKFTRVMAVLNEPDGIN